MSLDGRLHGRLVVSTQVLEGLAVVVLLQDGGLLHEGAQLPLLVEEHLHLAGLHAAPALAVEEEAHDLEVRDLLAVDDHGLPEARGARGLGQGRLEGDKRGPPSPGP